MRTELFTVSKIFTESLYRIPDYQRGYSWQIPQLKDFWLDLEQLESEGKHYTGVLTLEPVPREKWASWEDDRWIIQSRHFEPYYVVDGQQRLTTVIILIQAILDVCKESHLNFTSTQDIQRKYICDAKPGEIARSYIFGYEKDNPSYEYLKKRIFLEQSNHHSIDEDTIYTKNLSCAKQFFTEKLKSLSKNALEAAFTKTTQQLVFNVYEISRDIDVFVTFETMNNRGKPLSTLELLKNRLIYLSTKLDQEEESHTLRRSINDAWKTAYHYLGKNDERPLSDDEFLRTHLSYYYPTELARFPDSSDEKFDFARRRYLEIMEEFNRFLLDDLFTPKRIRENTPKQTLPQLSKQFIYDYSQHLKASVETYFKLSTPNQSNFTESEKIHLERIGRLRGFAPSTLLLAIYTRERDSKKRTAVLGELERYHFCSSLYSRGFAPFSRRNSRTPDLYVGFISGKNSVEQTTSLLTNLVSELLKETPLVEALNEWVRNGYGYYGWRSIKFFMYEYELELQRRTKSARQKIDWKDFAKEDYTVDYETIEHIYPKQAKHDYWKERFSEFNPTQKRMLRNSLGNLVALARPRNSSLGNKSFPDKLGDDENKTGYRYGSYSEIEVSRQTQWGPEEILNRGIALLDFLEKRWRVTIGDKSQKIRALGLEFLVKK